MVVRTNVAFWGRNIAVAQAGALQAIRSIADAHGKGKPLLITEWSSGGTSVVI